MACGISDNVLLLRSVDTFLYPLVFGIPLEQVINLTSSHASANRLKPSPQRKCAFPSGLEGFHNHMEQDTRSTDIMVEGRPVVVRIRDAILVINVL